MLAQAKNLEITDLQGRVTFMEHDFFNPQPLHQVSAFFIRQCIHNWNDEDCIKIFRALIPALEDCKQGTPLLINDTVMPELGQITRYEERNLRQLDLAMLVVLGAKQRTERDFRALLKEADERFDVSFSYMTAIQTTPEKQIANTVMQVVQVSRTVGIGLVEVHFRSGI